MNDKEHKSEKIHEVVHEHDRKLNLHEIKEKTGAGNGYKQHRAEETIDIKEDIKHKSEKIHEVVHEHDRKLNLHEIKEKTGAGNGLKHHE